MESQIKILGWLYIIFGILGILTAACVGAIIVGGGVISQDDTAIRVTTIVAIVLGVFLVLVSAPGIIAGWGLMTYQKWARVLAIIIGILNLPGFPIGTLLGIYTLIVLLDERTNDFFETNSNQTIISAMDQKF